MILFPKTCYTIGLFGAKYSRFTSYSIMNVIQGDLYSVKPTKCWWGGSDGSIHQVSKIQLLNTGTKTHLHISFLPPSLPSLTSHTNTEKCLFQRSLGRGWENMSCLYLSSNLYVIMQMHFAWSMQRCGHLVSLWTVINYSPSRQSGSAVDGFWLTAEQCDRLSRPASEFFWR